MEAILNGYTAAGGQPQSVLFSDGPNADSFGRQRVSNIGNRLDAEFIYSKLPDLFDEITNNGTVTLNANTRDLTLSLSNANNGSYAEMRSHPIPYTPGNSQLIDMTGVLDLANLGTGTAEIFVRTSISGSVTTNTYPQSTWATLTSGINWNYSHIFQMDFQSLKVGRIRFNLVYKGVSVNVLQIFNDNVRNSGYWKNPSLPAYWKLYTTGGNTYMEIGYGDDNDGIGFRYKVSANASATMKAICCTVKSEGGYNLVNMPGIPYSADRAQTAKTVSTTLVPVISIRPRSTFNTYDNLGIAFPKSVGISTDNAIRYVVIHDATLTNASWANVNTNESIMEYDTAATAFTGGHILYSDYVSTTKNTPINTGNLLGKTVLWYRRNSETGILTVAAVRTGGTDAAVLSTMNWEEIR